jgi:hypothetical protein
MAALWPYKQFFYTNPQHDFRATLLRRRTSRMPNGRHKQPRSSLTGDFMSTPNTISKIGAVFYIIWACLHLLAAYSVYVLGRSLDSSMVQGRVFQDAWNLLFFSIIAISVAATLNWRNSVWGYWINLATVGIADTGFIFFVLVPGYTPVWPSILGPVFWVLATMFSTIALLMRTKGATRSFMGDNTQFNLLDVRHWMKRPLPGQDAKNVSDRRSP